MRLVSRISVTMAHFCNISVWKLCLFIAILTSTQITTTGLRQSQHHDPFSSMPLMLATTGASSPGCSWTESAPESLGVSPMSQTSGGGGALTCNVRTLNTELWNSSTSSRNYISREQRLSASSLHIKCNDKLYFESFLLPNQSLFQLPKLGSIVIESCKIRKLHANINWRRLPSLRHLTIQTYNNEWSSSIELEIEPNAFISSGSGSGGPLFGGLQLETLNLSWNNIWSLPANIFCPLAPSLQTLNLSRNHLIEIPAEFADTSSASCTFSMSVLDLSWNAVRKLDQSAFANVRKLQKLILSDNYIDELEDDAFSELSSLKSLNLSSNRLVALPPSIFRGTSELSEIYLVNNSISALSPQVFSNLQQLLLLDLSRNLLSTQWIKENVFSGLIRLIVLKLSFNQLSFIDASLFSSMSSLQALYLNNNRIERLDPAAFASLTNLHILDLSRNLLTFIDGQQFSNSYILKQLSLDHNRIRTIDADSFHNCTSLQDLGLAGNLLLEVPLALSANSKHPNGNGGSRDRKNLLQLKTLDIGENKISFVTNESFSGLTKLYGLRMVDNRVSELPDHFCSSLNSLRVLNFGQNRLRRISNSAFAGCPELRALRLDKNQLEELPSSYAMQLPKLLWLNLTENQLKYINPAQLPPTLEWIDLSWNQLESLGDMYSKDDLSSSATASSAPQLRVLDASHNNLTFLDYRSIPSTLEALRLNSNKLKSIASDTFIRATRLRKIELADNEIETLPLGAVRFSTIQIGSPIPEISFAGNPFLCHCDLEWLTRVNQLVLQRQYPRIVDYDQLECRTLPYSQSSTTGSPGNSTVIPIAGNKISMRQAKPSDFLCPYKTLCFPLCQCCEFEACDCNYQCPDSCTCHHDTAWSANIVQCSSRLDSQNSQVPSRIPMDATTLYLDGNNFPTLPSHTFIGKRNLRVLYLNSSRVQILKNKTFNGLKSLEKLHLQDNLLTQLDGYELTDLENLSELYLHNNLLKYITPETFAHLKLLQVLRLDGNLLYDFNVWELSRNSYLNSVMLSSNPWSCDCEFIIPFRTWAASRASTIVDFGLAKCQLANNDRNNGHHNGNGRNNHKGNGYDDRDDDSSTNDQNQLQLSTSPSPLPSPTMKEGQQSSTYILINSRCSIGEDMSYNSVNHVPQANHPHQILNPSLNVAGGGGGVRGADSSVLLYNMDSDDDDSDDNDENSVTQAKYNKNSLKGFNSNATTIQEFDNTIFWVIFLSLASIMILTLVILSIVFRRQLSFWLSDHLPFSSCVHNLKCGSSSSCSSDRAADYEYSAGSRAGFGSGQDGDEEEKLFDAYFLYSRKDEDLLLYKICPELESPPAAASATAASVSTGNLTPFDSRGRSLRLCLHFRDLCLNLETNPWSPEMIQTACEVSRRVVILLSGSFIQTEWTNPEFRSVLQSVLSRHQKKVIFILLPPLSAHNLVGLGLGLASNFYGDLNGTTSSGKRSQHHKKNANLKGSTLEWTDESFWTKFKLLLPPTTTTSGTNPLSMSMSMYSSGNTNQYHHQSHPSVGTQRNCRHQLNNSINSNQQHQQQQQPCYNISQYQQQQLQQQYPPSYSVNSWSAAGSVSASQYFPNSQLGSQLSPQNMLSSRYYANNLTNGTLPPQWMSTPAPGPAPFPQLNNNYPMISPSTMAHHYPHGNHPNRPAPPSLLHQLQPEQLHLLQHQHQHQQQNSISTISATYRPLTEQNYSDSTNTLGSEDDELNHIYSTLDSPILQSPNEASATTVPENTSSLARIEFVGSTTSLTHCGAGGHNNAGRSARGSSQKKKKHAHGHAHTNSSSGGSSANTNASSSGISSCEELMLSPSSHPQSPISASACATDNKSHLHVLNAANLQRHLRSASASAPSPSENATAGSGQMYFV